MTRQVQQNLISMTAQGESQAVFPGGVQIVAGETSTPPNERRVRWVRESDGALIADIAAGGADPVSFGSTLEATVHRVPDYVPGIDSTQASLIARDENTAGSFGQVSSVVNDNTLGSWPDNHAYVFAMAAPNPPPSFANNPSVRVLTDENGASSLVGYGDLQTPIDSRLVSVGPMAIPGLAAGATALSAVVSTGMNATDNRPPGSAVPGPLPLNLIRFWGGFNNFVGNQLCWGYNFTTVAGILNVQIQVRNVTGAASAATTFAGTALIAYS